MIKLNKKNDNKVKNTITIDYENKKLSVFYYIPLLLIAGFVPLIVYAKYVDLAGTTQSLYWTGQHQYLDFFSYWKARWVMVLTAIALITYIILYKQKKLPLKNLKQYYIPLGIYAIFVIISTIFAKDTQTALWGFVDMYQGMFVLLSYVLITFLTINFVNNERDVNLFVNAFLFLMIVEGVIGVGQYFGFDLFQTKIGKDLILPSNLVVENMSFSFGPKTIYGTLFNTNFVGSFATLMLPISIALLLTSKTNKQKIISAIATVLMIFTWIGCNSRAGYLGIVVSAVLGLWLLKNAIIKHYKGFIGAVAILFIVLILLNSMLEGIILSEVKKISPSNEIQRIKTIKDSPMQFENIILGKDTFTIKTSISTLNFKIEGEKLFFLDENNKELGITVNGKEITINDSRYDRFKISIPKDYPGVTTKIANYWKHETINFIFTENGVKIIGSGGRITEPVEANLIPFLEGFELLASNRGYIWGATIPLLSKHIILGSGADNFPFEFPQDDFVSKLNIGMDANMVIDKPHNMYLQISINTGVISLIALLFVWVMYFISSFKLYSKMTYDSLDKYIGASCMVSVVGYLAAGAFNDQIISVAPLFWIVFGIGVSINYKLCRSIQK